MNLVQRAKGYLSGSTIADRYDRIISTWESLPQEYQLTAAMERARNFRFSFQLLGQVIPFALEVGGVVHSLFTNQMYSAAAGLTAGQSLRVWSTLAAHNYLHWAEPLAQSKQREYLFDQTHDRLPAALDEHRSRALLFGTPEVHNVPSYSARDALQISPLASVVPAISSSTAERV